MEKILIGCCLSFRKENEMRLAKELGVDCFESSFGDLSKATDEEIARYKEFLDEIGMQCRACNCMMSGEYRVTGENADFKKAEDYMYRTLEKTKALNLQRIVFGSNGARRVPDGFSNEKATEQLIEFCSSYLGPAAAKYGPIIVIEPLNKSESNIITTVAEGYNLVKNANHPNIKLLADFYHMGEDNDPVAELSKYEGTLLHMHIASSKNDRAFPKLNDGEDYELLFNTLKSINYGGNCVSIEARAGDDFKGSLIGALECLKPLVE